MKNGHFSSVSLSRHPVQLVILIPFFFSPASDAGFLRFVRGSLAPRLFFVLCPSLYLGPCFYSAGCYPAFSYVFSPASDAGVLPPLWRGRVFPFTVQSRDHLATITDIYVPSFSYVHSPAFNAGFYFVHCAMENCLDLAIRTGGAAGSDAPTQTLIRLFRRTGRPADTLVYKSHAHAYVCILRKGCPPVRLVTLYLLYSSNFGAKIGIKNESQISGLVWE